MPADDDVRPSPAPDPEVDPARAALARAKAAARGRRTAPGSTGVTGSAAKAAGRSGSDRVRRGRAVDPDEQPRSGPRPDDRDPQPLARAVESLVASRGWEAETAVGGLVGRWEEIMGPDIAAHVSVESFEADTGRVLLRADSTAWATQLRLLLPTVVRRLRADLGHEVVREVSVLGPAAPSWRKGPRSVPGRGPRDTYG